MVLEDLSDYFIWRNKLVKGGRGILMLPVIWSNI